MAFVNQSQRLLSQSRSETKTIGPGEYIDNDFDKMFIDRSQQGHAPFNSYSSRITAEIPHDRQKRTLGPGSYNIKTTMLKKSFSTKNYNSVNLIDKTVLKLIEKEKKEKENNWKKIKDKFTIHNKKKIKNSELNNSEVYSKINQSNKNTKYIQSTNTSNRICSIPSKNNNGYDYDKQDNLYIKEDSSKKLRSLFDRNNGISPDENDNEEQEKKKVKGVDWSRSSCKVTQGSSNRNLSSKKNNTITLDNTQITKLSNYTKDRSLRLLQKVKNPIRGLKKVHSTEDIVIQDILNNSPGPGYYFNEGYKGKLAKKSIDRISDAFISNADRLILLSEYHNNPDVGPGSYIKTKYPSKSVNFYPFVREEASVLPSSNLNPYLGPGSFNPKQVTKKAMSLYYGSFERRFNYHKQDESTCPKPGPGEYIEILTWGKNKSASPLSFKEQKIVENTKSEVPGVGRYHPGLVSSIEYKIKEKENKLQSFLAPFCSGEERFVPLQSIINNPGPGYYNNNPSKLKREKKFPLMTPTYHSILRKTKENNRPGPGSYELNNYHHWNNKSFNVLFV